MLLHLETDDSIMVASLPGLRPKDLGRKAFESRKHRRHKGEPVTSQWVCLDVTDCDSSHFRAFGLFVGQRAVRSSTGGQTSAFIVARDVRKSLLKVEAEVTGHKAEARLRGCSDVRNILHIPGKLLAHHVLVQPAVPRLAFSFGRRRRQCCRRGTSGEPEC